MLCAIDIGNSNIVMAIHDGSAWVANWRLYADQKKTSDEYFVVLESLLSFSGIDPRAISKAVISSVVPNLTRSIEKNIQRLFSIQPLLVTHDVQTGIARESIPVELGSDLLANATAAHSRFPDKDCMVLDFGTALTFTTVSSSGKILGVAITPGLLTAVNSLAVNTAQLPQVQLKLPETALGRDSDQSIRAGIMYGYAGMAQALIERTEEEVGNRLQVIATGGLSATMVPLIKRIDILEPLHTLNGLKVIAELN